MSIRPFMITYFCIAFLQYCHYPRKTMMHACMFQVLGFDVKLSLKFKVDTGCAVYKH